MYVANQILFVKVCDLLGASAGKRDISKRQSIACTQCCNTGPLANGFPCNGELCNQSKLILIHYCVTAI